MPRVHFVKSARKDNPVCKKGESYYWWKFRYGGKRYSLTPPRQSQLTQSEFLSSAYELMERVEELSLLDIDSLDEFKADVEAIAEEVRALGDEQRDKQYNMPDSLQEAEIGQLLEQRADAMDQWADELECVDMEIDEDELYDGLDEDDREEALHDRLVEILDEVQGIEPYLE